MVVLIEEEQKTLEYQEKMNVDVENTTNLKKIGDQYTKLLIIVFAAKKLFQQNF